MSARDGCSPGWSSATWRPLMSLPSDVLAPLPALAAVRTAGIAGVGAAVPDAVVTNAEIAPGIGVDAEWIERRTGIRSRRWARDGETVAGLAAAAGRNALDAAGLPASEV